MTGWRYTNPDGWGELGETICAAHATYRDAFDTEWWEPAPDDGTCFICAEDGQIARAERMT